MEATLTIYVSGFLCTISVLLVVLTFVILARNLRSHQHKLRVECFLFLLDIIIINEYWRVVRQIVILYKCNSVQNVILLHFLKWAVHFLFSPGCGSSVTRALI
jgi:hypothetical protein